MMKNSKSKELPSKPICPLCKAEMSITSFEGYYDSFCYWGCNCDDNKLKEYVEHGHHGQYT